MYGNSIEFIPRDEISVLPYSEMKLSTTEKKLFKYCETSIRVFVINSDAIPSVMAVLPLESRNNITLLAEEY
uniref:Uncharacterized protein n=1 Tax=Glossina palpalis gambiensis TaxID=67801 RepID=A0A1B0AT76_9MUSC